ncbi:hypothetical protein [Algiphilus sp.]|uniref:hypothetical protein n=1 Tax=Algiphilus sp. TaxID=1872431 RepID=UPI0032EC9A76
MNDQRYNKIDVVLRLSGGAFAVVLAVLGWCQYQELKERDFKKAYFDSQIALINDFFQVMTAFDVAATEQEKHVALQKFWMLYSAKSKLYLDDEMFRALEYAGEYVVVCVEKRGDVERSTVNCANTTASMTMSGFATAARRSLSQSWDLKFEEIGKNDPWLTAHLESR